MTGKKLFFISNYRSGLSCASGAYDITTGNNWNFKNASVLFYSPCTVTLNNQNDFTGQVLGNSVQILNHFTMPYQPVLIPGWTRSRASTRTWCTSERSPTRHPGLR